MLDDYKDSQKIIYQTIINSVKKNKLSHAYLIELTDSNNGLDFALAISKFLLCPNHYSNSDNCNGCNICHQVDDNNYIELKVIRPDGNYIKKNQVKELQENFRTESIVNNYKIYIILEAEKMNEEAANSLLKFLEEPNDGIIAILLTNNMYQVYNTIKSRCQILKMAKEKNIIDGSINKLSNYLYDNKEIDIDIFKENINDIIDFYSYLEKNKLKTIIFKNKNILQQIKNNFEIDSFFKVSTLLYKDALNIILNKELEYFNDYKDLLNDIAKSNNQESISKKINIIIDLGLKVKYNANQNLLLDKLVILFAEV